MTPKPSVFRVSGVFEPGRLAKLNGSTSSASSANFVFPLGKCNIITFRTLAAACNTLQRPVWFCCESYLLIMAGSLRCGL